MSNIDLNIDLACKFCKKPHKNKNAKAQHEIRCKLNPNKLPLPKGLIKWVKENVKGKTKETSKSIKKQSEKMKDLHKNNAELFKNAKFNAHRCLQNIYKDHNNLEIQKWIDYASSLKINIPAYTTFSFGKNLNNSYKVVSKQQQKINSSVKILLEHVYLMSFYVPNFDRNQYEVHHIDLNPSNNNISNLITFYSKSDHVRYHISPYVKLEYNENTKTFKSIIIKP